MSSAVQNTNLDLSDIATDDYDQLATKINTFYLQDSSIKSQLSYHWERNQLMLDGKQWITYQGDRMSGGQWRPLEVSSANEYIPRPVTNYMFDVYETLKSYLIKNKPRSKVFPNTQNHKDKMASQIGTLILEGNWARLKEQYNYETAAASLVTYGTVFKKSYWDTSSANLVKVPKMETVPVTDPMTGQLLGSTEQQASDPITGDLLFEELPIGDVNTYILDPFRITLDPLAMHLHDARWVLEYSIQSLDWVYETFSKEAPGYTGLAKEVQSETDLNGTMRRWFQLRTTSGTKDSQQLGGTTSATGSDVMLDNTCVVKEYYEIPSYKYPQGRMIVVANDKTVYSGDSPYNGPELGDWHPYSECRWEIVPGRFWGKSPLDAVAELQKRLNSLDAVIVLTRKTSAIPQKLIPMGSGVTPGSWTGRPDQEVYYRVDGGAKPETIPASGVHESVFQERAQIVNDIDTISGAMDILKGDKPPGADAASALNLLYEIGTGKIFPVLDRWKAMVENDQKKQLRLIGQKYKEPRPDFIRMLMSRNSDLNETDLNQFIGEDLYDNFNVVVEAGSNIPKLQAAKQAMLMQLAQEGSLNLQDPMNRAQFLQDLGIDGYNLDTEPDNKRAQWENGLLDNILHTPTEKPVVLAVDNHQIHISVHSTRMKSPQFMALPFPVQQAYMQHIQEHETMQSQAMQAQMLQQQAMAPKPGMSTPNGQLQPQGSGHAGGHGTPVSHQVKNAIVGADILTPASLGNGSR